ncbi:hypothetical protein K7432_013040 [Basidiobolus ranarum]|uniref:Tetratricopeptide SHNi-TPR domain-containing protein n=1 Tax=Basidiobolus ranarum TaxID=34480 RepID=A0ABR2VRC9_9FUNG
MSSNQLEKETSENVSLTTETVVESTSLDPTQVAENITNTASVDQVAEESNPISVFDQERVERLISEGKKALALSQNEEAVEKLGETSEMVGQKYGQLSTEYADVLSLYGQALLGNAVQQHSILGNKSLQNASDEMEPTAPAESSKGRFHFEGEPDLSEEEEEEAPEANGEEEQPDDFQTAWEVLDVARVIYSKTDGDEAKLKLGDVLLTLGDVSMESENFEQASADYTEALTIKKTVLESNDRRLAEAHYKIAISHEYNSQYDPALEHLAEVKKILSERIKSLEMGELNESSKTEIQDMQDLIQDIQGKVEDIQNAKQTSDAKPEDVWKEAMTGSSALPTNVINDLTNLIRSKKVQNTEEQSESVQASASEGSDLQKRPLEESTTEQSDKKVKF